MEHSFDYGDNKQCGAHICVTADHADKGCNKYQTDCDA